MSGKTRNAAMVQAANKTRGDTEVAKKREELQRRIEETRRKLQSVRERISIFYHFQMKLIYLSSL